MKLHDIVLFESFSTAKQVFGREASPDEVGKRLQQFKDLNQRNMLKPDEKDLGTWIKSGWERFNAFVADASNRTSTKQDKKAKKSDSVRVHENDNWLVVIPLSKAASCFYGAGTQWCTAATESSNYFDSYFHDKDVTLFYFINKKSGDKLAAALYAHGSAECFDAQDNGISIGQLQTATGATLEDLKKWRETHEGATGDSRNKFNDGLKAQEEAKKVESARRDMARLTTRLARIENEIKENKENLLDALERGERLPQHSDDVTWALGNFKVNCGSLYALSHAIEVELGKEEMIGGGRRIVHPIMVELLDNSGMASKISKLLDFCKAPLSHLRKGPNGVEWMDN